MVFKLVESAQARWRAVTGAHLVALVRAGAKFENGALVAMINAANRLAVIVHQQGGSYEPGMFAATFN